MGLKKREKYARATRGAVRQSAKNGPKQGGGPPLFNLPDGMELFDVKKSGIIRLNIVPYVVREQNHPERIKPKTWWVKRMFRTHSTPMGKIICPAAIDRTVKCRWCKKFFSLKKECDENEDLNDKQKEKILKPFSGQNWEAFFVINPKNPKKIMFYPTSWGKFPKKLAEVCETTSQKNLLYFEPTTDGRTLKCSFNKKKFNGSQFFECTNIEFKPREEIDEEMILKQTKDIASLLNVLPEETLKKMYYQNDEDEDRPGKSFKKSKSRNDEDDDSDEEDSDEEPRRKKKDHMAKDKSKKKSKKSDDDEEDDEDEKPSKKSKKSKKSGKVKKKAKDDDEDDEDEEDDEEEDEKPAKKKKGKKAKPEKKKGKKKAKDDDDEDEDEEE